MQKTNRWSFTACALACALSFVAVACDGAGGAADPLDQVETIRSALTSGALKINCGGPAASPFIADTNATGGSTVTRANSIDMSAVNGNSPAPTAVYQSQRFDTVSFSYTLTGLGASTWNRIRLHFADTHWTAAGQRVFNVTINGKTVLPNFDIIKTVGAGNKALIEAFTMQADSGGQYVIQFVKVTDAATVSGIEVAPVQASGTQTTTNGTAYAKLCAQQLVPLPPNWGGSGGTGTKCLTCFTGHTSCEGCVTGPNGEWKFSGQVSPSETVQSFNEAMPVDMFYWESTSTSTPGLCMMAVRQKKNDANTFTDPDVDFAGVICQAASGAVCYWDLGQPTQLHWNTSGVGGPNEQGHVIIPSSAKTVTSATTIPSPPAWVGGADLVAGISVHSYQTMCSDCHSGRNAFNNHPGTATDLIGRSKLTSSTDWMPVAWPSPIVPAWDPGAVPLGAPWPLNPGPQSWTGISSTCSGCHAEGAGNPGQFASASLATPGYCQTMITEAASRFNRDCPNTIPWTPTGSPTPDMNCPTGAMPPLPFATTTNSMSDGFVTTLLGLHTGQCHAEFRTQLLPPKGGGTLVNGPGTLATTAFTQRFYGPGITFGVNSQNKVLSYDPIKMQWLTTNGTGSKVSVGTNGSVWTIRQSGSTSFICETLATSCTNGTTCSWNCDSIGYAGYSQIVAGTGDTVWAVDANKFILYATTTDAVGNYSPDSFFAMGEWPVNDPISQVSVGVEGDMWVLSQNGNISHQTGGDLSGTFTAVPSPPGGGVVSLSVGNSSDVWAASSSGLYRFLPASNSWEKHCLTTGCGLAYTKVSAGGGDASLNDFLAEVWALDAAGNAYRVDRLKGSTQASISKISGATLTQLVSGGSGDVLGISSNGTVYSFQ